MGVGKTALCKRLAKHFDMQLVGEDAQSNPFLADFYQNPEQNALATQLHFLFQRQKINQQLPQDDLLESRVVSNFLLAKDQLFAQTILSEQEFSLYQKVYQQANIQTLQPDLVIYLQAPTDVLLAQIQKRGKDFEQSIQHDYLDTINQAYSQFFHYYDTAPLLIINSSEIDLINDDLAFKSLINALQNVQNGRHYFNPSFFNEAPWWRQPLRAYCNANYSKRNSAV